MGSLLTSSWLVWVERPVALSVQRRSSLLEYGLSADLLGREYIDVIAVSHRWGSPVESRVSDHAGLTTM
jgi:hypothetical protein